MRYKLHTGSTAWLIHRITGVMLALFIFFHFYALSPKAPVRFESLITAMNHPVSSVLLLGLVISHGLLGLRLMLIDMGAGARIHKPLFWLAALSGILLFILGSMPIIGGLK